MIAVTLVSPYPSLTRLAQSFIPVWRKQGVSLTVIQAIGADAVADLTINADAVICRGITGNSVRRRLPTDIPFIELHTTGYDVLQAIHACKSDPAFPERLAIIGTSTMIHGAQRAAGILGIALECHTINDDSGARKSLAQALDKGSVAIIGGSVVVGMAAERGIAAMLIESGEDSLSHAIEEAVHVARVAIRERTAAESFRISMDALAEGIVAVNAEGIITDCNTAAVQLLQHDNMEYSDLRGRLANQVIPNFTEIQALPRQEICDMPLKGEKRSLVMRSFPVVVKNAVRGVVVTLQEVKRLQELEGQVRTSLHSKGHQAKYTFAQCLGKSRVFLRTLEKANKYGASQASLLIYGETGTGKEIIAQSIHNAGPRANGPFVAINCAALPESLLESMLFGYADGAFTGAAKSGKMGLFEMAHNGTIFLDEVSEIPLLLQGRLLRALQEKEVMRIGHDRVIPVDVRVIAATNRNLAQLVEQGLFRGDLFYRLDVLELTIPPLRERPEDIALLTSHFLQSFCRQSGRPMVRPDKAALELLASHNWPGNVRELRNVCERLEVLTTGSTATVEDILQTLTPHPQKTAHSHQTNSNADMNSAGLSMTELTQQAIHNTLAECNGNKAQAAKKLGISYTTLWRKLRTEAANGIR